MTTEFLRVKHTVTFKNEPLVCFCNLPSYDAELTPAQIRALASTLLKIADDCEQLFSQTRRYGFARRDYAIVATPPATPSGFCATAPLVGQGANETISPFDVRRKGRAEAEIHELSAVLMAQSSEHQASLNTLREAIATLRHPESSPEPGYPKPARQRRRSHVPSGAGQVVSTCLFELARPYEAARRRRLARQVQRLLLRLWS